MVLTDPEDVEAELVGELDLFHEVLHAQRGADRRPGHRVGVQLGEGVETDLHRAAWNPGTRLVVPSTSDAERHA